MAIAVPVRSCLLLKLVGIEGSLKTQPVMRELVI